MYHDGDSKRCRECYNEDLVRIEQLILGSTKQLTGAESKTGSNSRRFSVRYV